MIKTVLKVGGMSCEHCVNAVRKAVGALDEVSGVAVDLTAGTVEVEYDPDTASRDIIDEIKSVIEEQGYDLLD